MLKKLLTENSTKQEMQIWKSMAFKKTVISWWTFTKLFKTHKEIFYWFGNEIYFMPHEWICLKTITTNQQNSLNRNEESTHSCGCPI